MGLIGMRERVKDLGGQVEITSSKDGIVVLVLIPMAAEEHTGVVA